METKKQRILFDPSEEDLKKVLDDMGILQLISQRLPEAEQGRALAEILPVLRENLEALADSSANKTGAGHTAVRIGSYYFQFKKSFYTAATLAAGVTALVVLGPATAGVVTAVALAPHVVGALRGVNDVLVKLMPSEVAVYEAVASVELEKRKLTLKEEGASVNELRKWYKSRGASTPTRLEKTLEILVNERRALRSWVGADDEVYYSVIP
jgi:hypothetical protein